MLFTQSIISHELCLLLFHFFFFFIFSEEGLKVPEIFFLSSPLPTPLAVSHLLLQEIHIAFSTPLLSPPGRGKVEGGEKTSFITSFPRSVGLAGKGAGPCAMSYCTVHTSRCPWGWKCPVPPVCCSSRAQPLIKLPICCKILNTWTDANTLHLHKFCFSD